MAELRSVVTLPALALPLLVQYAEEAKPNEACGIVWAFKDELRTGIDPAENISGDPTRSYELPPEAIGKALDLTQKGAEVAIYHSHPSGRAFPSTQDVQLARHPWPQIIVGLAPEPDVRAYWIENGRYASIPIEAG